MDKKIYEDENRLISERRDKLQTIREETNIPFPNNFKPDTRAADLQQNFLETSKADLESRSEKYIIAGRLIRNRGAFLELQDSSGKIQLYVNKDARAFVKTLDLGDIIGVEGRLFRSGKGDLYVDMSRFVMLTKALRPLPDKFHGLADQELRYRQRYVDLISNPEARNVFTIRSKLINYIRSFFNERNFMEVETPMLQTIPGGAVARPFITHHNALGIDMFMRIAPELFLKRLIVGGYDRVYEINRNFRNEGLSTRHNPEFTMLEFYQAYADYRDMMDLTEQLIKSSAENVLKEQKLTISLVGEDDLERDAIIDLNQPFTRMSVVESILKFNPTFDSEVLDDITKINEYTKRLGIDVRPSWGLGKIQTEIFEKTVESKLIQPTFITMYPAEVSPLARRNDENPFVTDRFEFFVGGQEIANGFSELNDPEDQAQRFKDQVKEKELGDEEAMYFDDDYIRALEFGMPPTAGEGIGIDRLVMLFTNSTSIKDVILFPHMRPES